MPFDFPQEEKFDPKFRLNSEPILISEADDFSFSFTFDYILFEGKWICFNNGNLNKEDYVDFIDWCRLLSLSKIRDIINNEEFHCHEIDINEKHFLKNILKRNFKLDFINYDDIPPIFQIGIDTNSETGKSPRICGFFGKAGIFHLLWYDLHHLIYHNQAFKNGIPTGWYNDY